MSGKVNAIGGLMTNPRNYDQLQHLITEWWHRRLQEDLGAPSNKKAEDLQKAKQIAYRQGVCAGLAALANNWRCQMFDKWERIPLLSDNDFYAFLVMVEEFMLRPEEPSMVIDDSPETKRKIRDEKRRTIQAFVVEEFAKIALPDEFDEYERDRHRVAVLAGEEEPTDADKHWLEAERARIAAEVEKHQKILDRI
jgi:hypothetical protein